MIKLECFPELWKEGSHNSFCAFIHWIQPSIQNHIVSVYVGKLLNCEIWLNILSWEVLTGGRGLLIVLRCTYTTTAMSWCHRWQLKSFLSYRAHYFTVFLLSPHNFIRSMEATFNGWLWYSHQSLCKSIVWVLNFEPSCSVSSRYLPMTLELRKYAISRRIVTHFYVVSNTHIHNAKITKNVQLKSAWWKTNSNKKYV